MTALFPAPTATTVKSAQLSADRVYRYELTRVWDRSRGRVCWVMLNPSTADGEHDDATVRRVVGFAKKWGYGSIVIRNLYALRSTDPTALWRHDDPIGPENPAYLARCALDELVVCAWGANGRVRDRGRLVADDLVRIGVNLHHLGLTKEFAQPKHPVRLAGDLRPVLWRSAL